MDNIKAVNPEIDSIVSDWHKKHKKHQATKVTPRTSSMYVGPVFFGGGCANDPDCDNDVDIPGTPDVDVPA